MSFVFFLNFCVKRMQLNGSGKIGVIGSIAGDRGKKSTIFLQCFQSFLENYVQGMQHKLLHQRHINFFDKTWSNQHTDGK